MLATPPAKPSPSAADRFAIIIEGLCRAVADRGGRHLIAGPIVILVWRRLHRTVARFAALAAQIRAGTLPSPTRRRRPAVSRSSDPAASTSARPSPHAPRLPRRFGWLLRLMPEAACFRSQLSYFLAEPDTAALLAAAPQEMGRLLLPLLWMLGLRVPRIPHRRTRSADPSLATDTKVTDAPPEREHDELTKTHRPHAPANTRLRIRAAEADPPIPELDPRIRALRRRRVSVEPCPATNNSPPTGDRPRREEDDLPFRHAFDPFKAT